MNKNFLEKQDSNITQSQASFLENNIHILSNSQGNYSEFQILQNQYQIETPLSTKGNVKSYCRIRPNDTIYSSLNKFKIENNNKTLWVDFTSELDKGNPSKQNIIKYNFTEIFWPSTSNQVIYQKICKENIEQLFTKHRNALIFVYGITNSGKTYTVNGNLNEPGILQYSLIDLMKEFRKLRENNNKLWHLTCTYIEIYNEEIFDLLSSDRKKLKLGMINPNKFFPQGATVKSIENTDNFDDFENILKLGEINRSKGETNANPYSSRSHSIFRAEISYGGNSLQDKVCIEPVSLCIVDLAGAERVSKSGVTGTGLKEAGNINTSLLCLKKCFDAMEANSKVNCSAKKVIVPVRESKLTSLFKEYFAAHQNITIICTINPDKNEMNDNRSVLNFGSHAMRVKTMKSWIKTNYNTSRNVSPSKNRYNSPLPKDIKRYRMYTNKKYMEKNNTNSKEKDSKCKEGQYSNSNSNNSSFSKKKNNCCSNSTGKIMNFKLIKNKKNENNINIVRSKQASSNDENSINSSYLSLPYEERIKCTTNPFQYMPANNFSIKFSATKEKLDIEQKMKIKQKEIKEKMSKKGENLKNAFNDFLKKMYYDNYNKNIEIYENQCKNIDLSEIEMLLTNTNKVYTFINPFAKNYEEDKKIFSKNLKICCGDNNLAFTSDLNNNRNTNNINDNNQAEDILRLKFDESNEHEHDQTIINDYLDRSNLQYETTKFKAYFGIGESLIKKMEEEKKIKNKEMIRKFESLNNEDIEMADKNHNIIDDEEIFNNDYNFKKKGKNYKKKKKYLQINKDNEEIVQNNEDENNNENKNNDMNNKKEEKINNNENEEKIQPKKEDKKPKKNKNKKKYLQKDDNEDIKEKENDENTNEEEKEKEKSINEDEEKEKERDKSKNRRKRNVKSKKGGKSKKSQKSDDSNSDTNDEDEIHILAFKKNRKKNKNKKNKKKKLESDNETEDSFSDDNINLKPPKNKKGKFKNKK